MNEQDAHQLAVASSDGMGGGEPARLQEVLVAKEPLAADATAAAGNTAQQSLSRPWLVQFRRHLGTLG